MHGACQLACGCERCKLRLLRECASVYVCRRYCLADNNPSCTNVPTYYSVPRERQREKDGLGCCLRSTSALCASNTAQGMLNVAILLLHVSLLFVGTSSHVPISYVCSRPTTARVFVFGANHILCIGEIIAVCPVLLFRYGGSVAGQLVDGHIMSRALQLYRRILRLHRRFPVEHRGLGDSYVKYVFTIQIWCGCVAQCVLLCVGGCC